MLLFLGITSFIIAPLLNPGFFNIHDNQHVARLYALDQALRAGVFPVRWVDGFGFGYGYALYNFYPPLAYYFSEIFHLLGLGVLDSIKLTWGLALLASGVSMFIVAKKWWGLNAGFVSGIFYAYSPYHAVDAYVRGALSELISFIWLPPALFCFRQLAYEQKSKWILSSAIFMSLLMLTHNLIFLPFVGIVFIWFCGFILTNNFSVINLRKGLINLFASFTLTFALTAFFWLPSLVEKKYTLVDSLLIKNLASYSIHFVCPEQLWSSAWGFGGSIPGCVDGMSFKVGKLHIMFSFLAVFLYLFTVMKKDLDRRRDVVIMFILFLFSLMMTTQISKVIWDLIPQLWYLQFPWRFLEFASLFASLLAGLCFAYNNSIFSYKKFFTYIGMLITICGVIWIEGKYFVPQKYLHNLSDKDFISEEAINWEVSATSFEYMPKSVATKTTSLNTLWVDIDKTKIGKNDKRFTVLNGGFTVKKLSWAPGEFLLEGDSILPTTIMFHITNFPGWRMWIDGLEANIDDNNPYRLMTINVPIGKHIITGKFTNTPVRLIGNGVTVITSVLTLIYVYASRRNTK